MEIVKQLQKFMKTTCKKYNKDNAFKENGATVQTLIHDSGVKFGMVETQFAALNILLEKGFIEPVESGKTIGLGTRIKLTPLCLDAVHQDWINDKIKSGESKKLNQDIESFIISSNFK